MDIADRDASPLTVRKSLGRWCRLLAKIAVVTRSMPAAWTRTGRVGLPQGR
jgi:hypothetical protein